MATNETVRVYAALGFRQFPLCDHTPERLYALADMAILVLADADLPCAEALAMANVFLVYFSVPVDSLEAGRALVNSGLVAQLTPELRADWRGDLETAGGPGSA